MYHENVVYLIGNIGRKDNARYLPDGTKAVTISVATDEHFTSRTGEKQKRTNWHRCVGFGKIADILDDYTAKGSYVRLTGKLQTREYENQDGKKQYITEVRVSSVGLLDRKNGNSNVNGSSPASDLEASDDPMPEF